MSRDAPSWSFGCRQALRLWRLVLAVFVGNTVVLLPAQLALWAAAGGAAGSLPVDELPDGELGLVALEVLRPVWPTLAASTLAGWLALWAWTVLWHAGVVRWWSGTGGGGTRLVSILGPGLVGWWRWARLGLVSLTVLALGHGALRLGWRALGRHASDTGDDSLLGIALVVAAAVSLTALVLCWLATLRGAWLLGSGGRRSAVLAWLAGLWGSVTQPLRSLATLVLWSLPGLVLSLLPAVAGWRYAALRSPVAAPLLDVVSGLLAAFCWVGLFLSFAPVTGVERGEGEAPGVGG